MLSIAELEKTLNEAFPELGSDLPCMRLQRRAVPTEMKQAENRLRLTLPVEFADLVTTYDFGKLSIGPVAFGATGDYERDLLTLNEQTRWWGDGARPGKYLLIANSDPYAILLDTKSGTVLAYDAELGWQHAKTVAASFDLFIRVLVRFFFYVRKHPIATSWQPLLPRKLAAI